MKNFFLAQILKATLAIALILVLHAPVHAAPEGISQQEAAGIAQKTNPGRVLGVKQKGDVYKVKILNADGEVRVIVIDADSGRVISGR